MYIAGGSEKSHQFGKWYVFLSHPVVLLLFTQEHNMHVKGSPTPLGPIDTAVKLLSNLIRCKNHTWHAIMKSRLY